MRRLPPADEVWEVISKVRVFLDDLEEIAAAMQGLGLQVRFFTNSHEYDTVTEVREHLRKVPPRLEIVGYLSLESPSDQAEVLTVKIEGASLTYTASKPLSFGPAFIQLTDELRSLRRTTPLWRISNLWYFFAMLFAIWAGWLMGHASSWGASVVAAWLFCASLGVVSAVAERKWYGVQLRSSNESSVLGRNKDALIVGVASAVAGAVLTGAIAWAVGCG